MYCSQRAGSKCPPLPIVGSVLRITRLWRMYTSRPQSIHLIKAPQWQLLLPSPVLPPELCKNKENVVTALVSNNSWVLPWGLKISQYTINKSLQKALQTKGQILTKCLVQMQIYPELSAAQPGNPPALALPQPGGNITICPRMVSSGAAPQSSPGAARSPFELCVYIPALRAHTVQTTQYQQHKPPTILVRESMNRPSSYVPARVQASSSAWALAWQMHLADTFGFRSASKHMYILLVTGSNYRKDQARTAKNTEKC